MRRAGIVLCGGRSRRMGRPKALLPWHGRRMVDHVVECLAPCVDEVLVVTSAELARHLEPSGGTGASGDLAAAGDIRIVVDREPDRGPLAALRDGLAAMRAELAFVTTADAPFLTAAHVDALLRAAIAEERDGAPRAIVPRADGFLQVLSAAYPRSALPVAESLLAAGIASPAALVERLDARVLEVGAAHDGVGTDDVPRAAFPAFAGGASAPWTGFNTPGEYLALARREDPGATARVEWRRASVDGHPESERVGESTSRAVPIGTLDEVLRAAAPRPGEFERARAEGRIRVVLAEGELARDFEGGLPIGPGEDVLVLERAGPTDRAGSPSR